MGRRRLHRRAVRRAPSRDQKKSTARRSHKPRTGPSCECGKGSRRKADFPLTTPGAAALHDWGSSCWWAWEQQRRGGRRGRAEGTSGAAGRS